ncbi:BrnA antitoxin family protein [Albidovulum sp.]|uniref:BrnA antitoxin family protein n=1 Tax=Albidovulum sp. TaxID=1872424 RepID=UPI0025BA8DAD|nr:BrnA antitoxin family protein [Defluviimonas sp.]
MPRQTPRPTRAEKDRLAAYHELAETMRGLEEDLRWGLRDSLRLPREWLEIATDPAVPGKAKVTRRLDEDVLRFFRAMGTGYLTRINAVLRTFMLARLAGLVGGPEHVGYAPTAEEEGRALRRELLDHAVRVAAARETAEGEAEARAKLAGLRALRDARVGR